MFFLAKTTGQLISHFFFHSFSHKHMLWHTHSDTHSFEQSLSGGPCCWVCFSEFFFRGGDGAEWLPCRHVITFWKVCFTLFISSFAKLGVFYALTHFGMEKHEKKKLTWLPVTWRLSPAADCEWGRRERRRCPICLVRSLTGRVLHLRVFTVD